MQYSLNGKSFRIMNTYRKYAYFGFNKNFEFPKTIVNNTHHLFEHINLLVSIVSSNFVDGSNAYCKACLKMVC